MRWMMYWRTFSSCSTCAGLLKKSSPHKDLAFAIAIPPVVGCWPLSNYGLSAQVGLYLLQAASSGLRYQEVDEDRSHHTDTGEYPEHGCRTYQRNEREEGLRDYEVSPPVAKGRHASAGTAHL